LTVVLEETCCRFDAGSSGVFAGVSTVAQVVRRLLAERMDRIGRATSLVDRPAIALREWYQ
jgi:hypothetical protein